MTRIVTSEVREREEKRQETLGAKSDVESMYSVPPTTFFRVHPTGVCSHNILSLLSMPQCHPSA